MRRRDLLLGSAPAVLRSAVRKPNILWLMTDEQRPDSLGCYRSPWAHAPHLDALADAGVVFENAYVPSPVCVACRSSLLTGQAASTTGVLHNQGRLRPDAKFLTWRFEEAGYQTASFGKKHYFGGSGRPAFQTEGGKATEGIVDPERYGPAWKAEDFDVIQYPGRPGEKLQRRWILAGRFPVSEDQTAEARNAALARQWLEARDPAKPFLLRLSLNAPHTPVVSPPSYLSLIRPELIRIPSPAPDQLAGQPERERVILRRFAGSDVLNPEQIAKARHYYYARCAFADAICGRLLDWLRSKDLLDNTVVAMISDHGTHLGDQGLLQKQTFYEQVATVPYFFWSKDSLPRKQRLRTPVSVLSLLPTLLELAGLPSGGADCASLAPALQAGKEPPARPVVSEIAFGYQGWRDQDRQVMIREGEWKLTLFADRQDQQRFASTPDGALYNLARDPDETRNLFRDPRSSQQIQELLTSLRKWDHNPANPQ